MHTTTTTPKKESLLFKNIGINNPVDKDAQAERDCQLQRAEREIVSDNQRILRRMRDRGELNGLVKIRP